MPDYPTDVLQGDWRPRRAIPEVIAAAGLVVEDAASGFCGAVISVAKSTVTLADRHGRTRHFPFTPAGFLLDGVPTTLVAAPHAARPAAQKRTASGSVAVDDLPARVARASRIWVEGDHDAALVERIWGADLRIEAVVVEPIRGLDDLPSLVRDFTPGPTRRLGVLADHLVAGSKESRIAAQVTSPHVCITGHPYVDIWQAVKPAAVGLLSWPMVPPGQPWKDGVARSLGYRDPGELWRRVLASVASYTDVEVPLLRAVEELIDFVTAS